MPHLLGQDFVSDPVLSPSNPHLVPGRGGGGGAFGVSLTHALREKRDFQIATTIARLSYIPPWI